MSDLCERAHVATPQALVPVTLLTGFLGSGKTTLVNRLLTQTHGKRLAVIVNEFGELGIDGALIKSNSGTVIELANGCVCCATRGDLFASLDSLMDTSADLDGILIETSGLANPYPVIDDLERYQQGRPIRFDSVVTVVDADNFDRNLDNAEVAYEQITLGDLLLVNKSDLVSGDTLDLIETGLRKLNTRAPVVRCVLCDVLLELVMEIDRTGSSVAAAAHDAHHHDHDHSSARGHGHGHEGFDSFILRCERPLDVAAFNAWIDALPARAFRVKGFVRFEGAADATIVHVVGDRKTLEPAQAPIQTPGATLVVIGRHLDGGALAAGLRECMVSGSDGAASPSAGGDSNASPAA
jgi:G3E family GTPase